MAVKYGHPFFMRRGFTEKVLSIVAYAMKTPPGQTDSFMNIAYAMKTPHERILDTPRPISQAHPRSGGVFIAGQCAVT